MASVADAMSSPQQSAFDLMTQMLDQYNLGSLAGTLRNLILGGVTDANSLQLALQDTPEWKTRFAGNEALKQKGLPVMSVSEYLATERSYSQIMKNAGVPSGFYDDPADFAKFIGHSVSPSELQDRVAAYADLAGREDAAMKDQLKSMGLGDGHLLAYMIDPNRAAPLIQRDYKTALIGAAARRTGLTPDNGFAQQLATQGVSEAQAAQGYGLISENLNDMERLGQIYGQDFTQHDFESEVFQGNGAAAKKRKRLASQERAAFSGSSGVGRGSLTQDTSGQF